MARKDGNLRRRRALFAGAVVAAGFAGYSARAATYSWIGGTSPFWEDSGNWAGGAVPIDGSDVTIVFTGGGGLTSQDITSDLRLNNLTFVSGTGGYSILGAGLDFRTSPTNTAPTIVQNSSSGQSLNNITLTGTLSLVGSGTGVVTLANGMRGPGALNDNSSTAPLHVSGGSFSYLSVNDGSTEMTSGSLTLTAPGSTGFTDHSSLFVDTNCKFIADSGAKLFTVGSPQVHNNGQIQLNGATWTNSPSADGTNEVRIGYAGGTSQLLMNSSTLTTGGLVLGHDFAANPGHGNISLGTFSSLTTDVLTLDDPTGLITVDTNSQFNVSAFITKKSGTIIRVGNGGTLILGNNAQGTAFINTLADVPGQSSPGTVRKIGSGSLIFSGTASGYSGNIEIREGSVAVTDPASLGTGTIVGNGGAIYATSADRSLTNPVQLASGSLLNIITVQGDTHNLTLSGPISGAGSLSIASPGATVTLAGTNSFAGGTTVTAGTLNFNNSLPSSLTIGNSSNPGAPGSVVVNGNGSSSALNGKNITIYPDGRLNSSVGTLDSIGNLTMTAGEFDLNSLLGFAQLTVNGSSSAAKIVGGSFIYNNGTRTLTIGRGTSTYDLDFQSSFQIGSIIKTGPGIMRLGQPSFDRKTLNDGTLAVADNKGLGQDPAGIGGLTPSTFTFAGGAIVGDGGDRNLANPITLTGSGTIGSSVDGTPRAMTFSGDVTVANSATLTIDNNAATAFAGFALGSSTLAINAISNATIVGQITSSAGSGSLIKTGSGTLTLNGATDSSAGTLQLLDGNLLQNAGTLILSHAITTNPQTTLSISGRLGASGGAMLGAATINSGGTLFNGANPLYVFGGSGLFVSNGGSLGTLSGGTIELGGLLVNNGTLSGAVDVNFGGYLAGIGTFGTVNITAGGVFSPGAGSTTITSTPASVILKNNLALAANSTLQIDLGGPTAGSDYDQITQTSGTVSLGGTLQIERRNNFVPTPGQLYLVLSSPSTITGDFAQVTGNQINDTTWLATIVNGNLVQLAVALPGDDTLDGSVNTADFITLASNFNKTNQNWPGGDFNGDGKVNALDFNLLASHFGQTLLNSPTLGSVVPEPLSFSIGLVGVAGMVSRRRSHRGIGKGNRKRGHH